jgi:hypothetical protein
VTAKRVAAIVIFVGASKRDGLRFVADAQLLDSVYGCSTLPRENCVRETPRAPVGKAWSGASPRRLRPPASNLAGAPRVFSAQMRRLHRAGSVPVAIARRGGAGSSERSACARRRAEAPAPAAIRRERKRADAGGRRRPGLGRARPLSFRAARLRRGASAPPRRRARALRRGGAEQFPNRTGFE